MLKYFFFFMCFMKKMLWIITPIIIALDQLVKWWTLMYPQGFSFALIPHVLWFTHVRNTGISFGQLQGNNALMIWVVLIVLGLLIYWHEQFKTVLAKYAYWLIIGGLFGNLIDRILHGSVVDMFNLGWFPVFNIADAAISIAVVLLIIDEIKRPESKKSHRSSIKLRER